LNSKEFANGKRFGANTLNQILTNHEDRVHGKLGSRWSPSTCLGGNTLVNRRAGIQFSKILSLKP
jgi:hypothetical protein